MLSSYYPLAFIATDDVSKAANVVYRELAISDVMVTTHPTPERRQEVTLDEDIDHHTDISVVSDVRAGSVSNPLNSQAFSPMALHKCPGGVLQVSRDEFE